MTYNSETDLVTGHTNKHFNKLKSQSEHQFNRIIPEENNETELRAFSQSNTNHMPVVQSNSLPRTNSQSDHDTNINDQSEDRTLYEKHRLSLQTNEVEDRPTAMRLTGLRKPLSVTDLYRGTWLLLLQLL